MIRSMFILLVCGVFVSCKNADISSADNVNNLDFGIEKITSRSVNSETQEVAEAYRQYLNSDKIKHENKKHAQMRLAQIEMDMVNTGTASAANVSVKHSSIPLLLKTLQDYPEDKNNDLVLYQLANAYALDGDEEHKIQTLEKLTDSYPQSQFYLEALFRLGESYIAKARYIDSELVLTSVIIEDSEHKYTKNARFKRAWSLYKQGRYQDAITDYNVLLAELNSSHANTADSVFADNIYKIYSHCVSYIGIEEFLPEFKSTLSDQGHRQDIYLKLADILQKEGRSIDAASVYLSFLQNERHSHSAVFVNLSDLWINYKNKDYAVEKLSELESKFGLATGINNLDSVVLDKLRSNLVYISEYYHSLFQKTHNKHHAENAIKTYSVLVTRYPAASIVKQNLQYAELLQDTSRVQDSLRQYEYIVANYTDTVSFNKAALSILSISSALFRKNELSSAQYADINNKYITKISASDKINVMQSYATHLYNNKQYADLVIYVSRNTDIDKLESKRLIFLLASSEFEMANYAQSENYYQKLTVLDKNNSDYKYRHALAVYKRADNLSQRGRLEEAIAVYNSIISRSLNNDIVLLSLIDISSLYMRLDKWADSIAVLEKIRKIYPANKFEQAVTNKLSIAYLNNNNDLKAAVEFEAISKSSEDLAVRRSSLWQSAELFENAGDYNAAIRSYRLYANTYPAPLSLHIEAVNKLTELYHAVKDAVKQNYWLTKIINTTNKAGSAQTERMRYLSSRALLTLAEYDFNLFEQAKLTLPLDISLKRKKTLMSNVVKRYQGVANYNLYEDVTEAVYKTGHLYYSFSRAINESQRPDKLNSEELEQYNILLEDQAIMFEDQAIRYYQQNINSILKGRYSVWVGKSLDQLSAIYPSKYKRNELIETTVQVF